jgi:hypothetical protein
MMTLGTNTDTKNWPDLAINLYERLTGRGAEIAYDLRNIELQVPNKVGPDAEHTLWKVNGVLIIRTCESSTHPTVATNEIS